MHPTVLVVLAAAVAAAAVRAAPAPAPDSPPKYNRPIPEKTLVGDYDELVFRGWEEVRWHNTNKCLTAPDKPYEGAGVFLADCTGAHNQLWTGRDPLTYDNILGLYGGKPWSPEWWISGDLERGVPAKLVRRDPEKPTPYWSTPPTNKGRFEVTQYKDAGPRRYYMGYCLEVPRSKADCPPVMMARCNRGKRQRWTHYGKNMPWTDEESTEQ